MTDVYKFSRPVLYLVVFCSTLLSLFFVTLGIIVEGTLQDRWLLIASGIAVAGVFGTLSYFMGKSKITTSPEYISWEFFWIKSKSPWENVEGLSRNDSNGSICLTFKESIYEKPSILFWGMGNDAKRLALSSYIDNVAPNNLLTTIAGYVPTAHNKKFAGEFSPKYKAKIYETAEIIGIYYILWLFFQFAPMFLLSEFASKLFSTDVTKMPVVIDMMWKSLAAGLFFITLISKMNLLNFNTAMARMSQNEISHKARSYYIYPFVTIFLGFIIGLGIWLFEQESLFVIKEGNILYLIIAVSIGIISMQISNKLEWLVFRDYRSK
jgi:hypothetical protein